MSFNLEEFRAKVSRLNAILQVRGGEGSSSYAEAVSGLMDEIQGAWYGPKQRYGISNFKGSPWLFITNANGTNRGIGPATWSDVAEFGTDEQKEFWKMKPGAKL